MNSIADFLADWNKMVNVERKDTRYCFMIDGPDRLVVSPELTVLTTLRIEDIPGNDSIKINVKDAGHRKSYVLFENLGKQEVGLRLNIQSISEPSAFVPSQFIRTAINHAEKKVFRGQPDTPLFIVSPALLYSFLIWKHVNISDLHGWEKSYIVRESKKIVGD